MSEEFDMDAIIRSLNEMRLRNTMLRLGPSSLENLAFKTILNNILRYKGLLKKKVSPPFRKNLFDAVMDNRRKYGNKRVWELCTYLEPHRRAERFSTIEVEFLLKLKEKSGQTVEQGYRVSIEEVLRYLGQCAPNLKKLQIRDFSLYTKSYIYKSLQLETSATDLICQMKNLTHISFAGAKLKFSGFASICEEIENLQEIKADRISADVDQKSMKMTLETFDSTFDHQEYAYNRNYAKKIGIIFKKTDAVDHFRKAYLKFCVLDLDFLDSIPELTHLKKIKHDWEVKVQPILRKVGEHLKHLSLYQIPHESKTTFKHIFEHCKCLEFLYLEDSYVADDDEPINSFGKLKEFYCKQREMIPITLNSILSAPLLQKVVIKSFHCIFELGDKEALYNRIESGEILTNVREFEIVDFKDHDPNENHLNRLISEADDVVSPSCITSLIEKCFRLDQRYKKYYTFHSGCQCNNNYN